MSPAGHNASRTPVANPEGLFGQSGQDADNLTVFTPAEVTRDDSLLVPATGRVPHPDSAAAARERQNSGAHRLTPTVRNGMGRLLRRVFNPDAEVGSPNYHADITTQNTDPYVPAFAANGRSAASQETQNGPMTAVRNTEQDAQDGAGNWRDTLNSRVTARRADNGGSGLGVTAEYPVAPGAPATARTNGRGQRIGDGLRRGIVGVGRAGGRVFGSVYHGLRHEFNANYDPDAARTERMYRQAAGRQGRVVTGLPAQPDPELYPAWAANAANFRDTHAQPRPPRGDEPVAPAPSTDERPRRSGSEAYFTFDTPADLKRFYLRQAALDLALHPAQNIKTEDRQIPTGWNDAMGTDSPNGTTGAWDGHDMKHTAGLGVRQELEDLWQQDWKKIKKDELELRWAQWQAAVNRDTAHDPLVARAQQLQAMDAARGYPLVNAYMDHVEGHREPQMRGVAAGTPEEVKFWRNYDLVPLAERFWEFDPTRPEAARQRQAHEHEVIVAHERIADIISTLGNQLVGTLANRSTRPLRDVKTYDLRTLPITEDIDRFNPATREDAFKAASMIVDDIFRDEPLSGHRIQIVTAVANTILLKHLTKRERGDGYDTDIQILSRYLEPALRHASQVVAMRRRVPQNNGNGVQGNYPNNV